jgi:hypothetical protein
MEYQYIYLVYEREFINANNNIYKIGKSKQENTKRFNQYPKSSILLFQINVYNCDKLETELINIFKQKFIHRVDIGYEYFQGGYHEMIDIIFKTCQDNNKEYLQKNNNEYVKLPIKVVTEEITPNENIDIIRGDHFDINELIKLRNHYNDTNNKAYQDAVINYINNYYIIITGLKVASILHISEYRNNRVSKFVFVSFKQMKNIHAPILDELIIWRNALHQRRTPMVTFIPTNEQDKSDNTFNLYNGMKFKPDENLIIDYTLFEPMMIHIKEVLCGGDGKVYDYLLNLITLLFTTPHIQIDIHPILIGSNDIGKILLYKWLGKIITSEHRYISNHKEDMLNDANKLLICCEDSYDNTYFDQFKISIINRVKNISRKYSNLIHFDDYAFYIFNTTHKIKIDRKERQFFCLDCNDNFFNNYTPDEKKQYFTDLDNVIKNIKAQEHFFNWICRRDITDFDKLTVPITKKNIIQTNMLNSNVIVFIYDVVYPLYNNKNNYISLVSMYKMYKDWCIKKTLKYKDPNLFKKEFDKYLPFINKIKRSSMHYVIIQEQQVLVKDVLYNHGYDNVVIV